MGKTTLAHAIQAKTKGHILHCTWKKEWTMWRYFSEIMKAAQTLNGYQDVIIDRWCPSEIVYGKAFRGGSQAGVKQLLDFYRNDENIMWVMCRNENAIENHKKLMKKREEMFDDMTKVVKGFYFFYKNSGLPWIEYDYDKVDMNKFVEDLVGASTTD